MGSAIAERSAPSAPAAERADGHRSGQDLCYEAADSAFVAYQAPLTRLGSGCQFHNISYANGVAVQERARELSYAVQCDAGASHEMALA